MSSNSLTRKKSTTPKSAENEKRKKKAPKKLSPSDYHRITQDLLNSKVNQSNYSFQDILAQNQSLLSTGNLHALQSLHAPNAAAPTPFLQQMMQNQAAADHSSSLLAAIQAQQLQAGSFIPPSSYGLPQNPEVSKARADAAATLTNSTGKPPRYPTPSSSGISGTVLSNQPIVIPSVSSARADGNSGYPSRSMGVDRSALSSTGKVSSGPSASTPKSSARSPSPAAVNVSSTKKTNAKGSATKATSGSKTKRKSSIESAGPTKVLYRPLPSPSTSFGTSRRM